MRQTAAERLAELVPPSGIRQLVALIEELRRRASSGRKAPRVVHVDLEVDEATGKVLALVVPQRFGWEETGGGG